MEYKRYDMGLLMKLGIEIALRIGWIAIQYIKITLSDVPAKLARKIAAAKKRGRGGNFFPLNPLSFPPRPSVRLYLYRVKRGNQFRSK